MTKPSIDRIIRDSQAECLVLSQGEAKVMVDEIVRLRGVLRDIAEAPCSMVNDSESIRFSFNQNCALARNALKPQS